MRTPKIFLSFFFVIVLAFQIRAQNHHEFLANLNYSNLNYTRSDSFPGVAWIEDNSAYDENSKRFFFLGNNYAMSGPWKLFTVNAVAGTIIFQPPSPNNLPGYQLCCLEYDNTCDTLYAICFSGSNFYSSWIDPATGNVYQKQLLGAVSGYAPGISTFDQDRHTLLFEGVTSNGIKMIVVNARTGAVVSMSSVSAGYFEYDNTDHHLYGIGYGSSFHLDSIEETTGVQHTIGALPSMGIYQNGISAIDEANQKFIFCANMQGYDSLFTLDLQTGTILNEQYYQYANSSQFSGENLIFYCFDQAAGQLYALNWGIDTVLSEGIAQSQQSENSISVFPDPATEYVQITFRQCYSSAEVTAYNSIGEQVYECNSANAETLQIPVYGLPAGVYFLEVKTAEFNETLRIVKQ